MKKADKLFGVARLPAFFRDDYILLTTLFYKNVATVYPNNSGRGIE